MKIHLVFKCALIFIIICLVGLTVGILICKKSEESIYGLLIMAACFVATIATMTIWGKLEAENDLKIKEFKRKEDIKLFEARIEKIEVAIQNQPKQFDAAKELIALLKDFKEDKSADFQKFIEWTQNNNSHV